MAAFTASTVSDGKRVARGEHWLLIRSLLRARDRVHHAPWKILMIAGGAPAGEIGAIRGLMPKSHITAVDLDPSCVDAARTAGADDAFVCDLWDRIAANKSDSKPASALEGRSFDAFAMDLCNSITPQLVRGLPCYLDLASVLIVTVSYGREVVEFIRQEAASTRARWWTSNGTDAQRRSARRDELLKSMPPPVAARVTYLLGSNVDYLRSVLTYQGANMPMLSLVLSKKLGRNSDVSVEIVGPDDFEAALTQQEVMSMYDCPADRLAALRRSMAARKAVATRRLGVRSGDTSLSSSADDPGSSTPTPTKGETP
jgi:hypothetical protein